MIRRAHPALNALKAATGRKAEERYLLTLYKSLVLSTIDYEWPIISISQNQMNRLERLQNIGLRIITGCTRSTSIVALQYLTGIPSIADRQRRQQATMSTKVFQDSIHPLYGWVAEVFNRILNPTTASHVYDLKDLHVELCIRD